MKHKKIFACMVALLVITTGASAIQYWQLEQLKRELQETTLMLDKISGLFDDMFEPFLSKEGSGIIMTKNFELKFMRANWDRFDFRGPTSVLFYSPRDDAILQISLTILYPLEGLTVPIVVQNGNAMIVTYATEKVERGGFTALYSPIVWSINATGNGIHSIELPLKGWYTLSISGRIDIIDGGINHPILGSKIVNGTWVSTPVEVKAMFRVLHNDAMDIFAIKQSYIS